MISIHYRKILILLVLFFSFILLLVTLGSVYFLYKTSEQEQLKEFENSARSLAALIEATAQFDIKYSANTHPLGSWGATMSQIEQGIAYQFPRYSEEILIGIPDGEVFKILTYHTEKNKLYELTQVSFNHSALAEPLRRALRGNTGSGILPDYAGEMVLAGYSYVPSMNIGIVYKINLNTMQNPYKKTALWIVFAYALSIPFASIIILFITRPLKKLAEKRESIYEWNLTQKESELIESESRLKLTQRIAKIGSWDYNLITNELQWSDETFEIFGLDKNKTEISYDLFLKIIHPDDREKVDINYQKSINEKSDYDISHRIILPDGTVRWVQEIGQTHFDGIGSPLITIGSVQDVTERVNLHEKQKATNQILEAVVDTTPVMIAYLDTDLKFVYVNKAYADADGKNPDFFPGKKHFDIYPNTENENIFRNVLKTGEAYTAKAKTFEYEFSPDRGVSHWDWTLTPINNADGSIQGLVLSVANVTDRIEALELFQISEQKLLEINENLEKRVEERTQNLTDALELNKIILDTSSVGISAYSESGECIFANEAICRMIGASYEQVIQQNYKNIPSWKKFGLLEGALKVLETGLSHSGEYYLETTFGKKAWYEIIFSRFKKDGQPHLLIQITDRTESKKVEMVNGSAETSE